MKKIVITSLTILLVTQSQNYLLAPVEPVKVEPAKEHVVDETTLQTAAKKNYENEISQTTTSQKNNSTETLTTKQKSSINSNTIPEKGISLEQGEKSEEEEEDFNDLITEKGAESDVEHAQERVKEDSENKKEKAEEVAQEITDKQAEAIENLIETTLQELETNSSESSKILEKTAEKMGITSLAPNRQNIIMQNLKTEWYKLTQKHTNSLITADEIKEFLSTMYTTIQKG